MNILISIDSFKGSMTSMQAGEAAKKGILKAVPDADVLVCPLADGGEGTTDALTDGMDGEKISLTVNRDNFVPISISVVWVLRFSLLMGLSEMGLMSFSVLIRMI